MRTVVSCSRRTDIPASHLDWFKAKVREGFVAVPNPYTKIPYRVSLEPEDVHTFVLWSKDFREILNDDSFLQSFRLYFHFTVNDCPSLEPHVPSLDQRLEQIRKLAERYGPERINWRFDPIVLWDDGKKSNLRSFERIASVAAEAGVKRCTFSFATWYGKIRTRPEIKAARIHDPGIEERKEILTGLIEILRPLGITLFSCCMEGLDDLPGVEPGACIDGRLLSQLAGERCSLARDTSQRKACRCTVSKDIGGYDQPCYHGCFYCYANPASGRQPEA